MQKNQDLKGNNLWKSRFDTLANSKSLRSMGQQLTKIWVQKILQAQNAQGFKND